MPRTPNLVMTTRRFFHGHRVRDQLEDLYRAAKPMAAPTANGSRAFLVELAGDEFRDRIDRGLRFGADRGDDDRYRVRRPASSIP